MIYINGIEYNLLKETPLLDVLNQNGIPVGNGIAIAINNKVVTKLNWETQRVKLNDNILLIKATQGG